MVTLKLPTDDDIARLIQAAGESGEPLLVDIGDTVYELDVNAIIADVDDDLDSGQPDAILGIIGIGASAEPTDVARRKHEYLADAFDTRSK
jgi:hypothetical protein